MKASARQNVLAAILVTGFISYVCGACATLGVSQPPLTASLHADSPEIEVHLGGYTYFARIPFEYVNTTPGPIAGGHGCGYPDLEKNVNGKWVMAYRTIFLGCDGYIMRSGQSLRDSLVFFPAQPGHGIWPEFELGSIDGIYRLRADFVQGTEASAKRARRGTAVSNEFRMVLKRR